MRAAVRKRPTFATRAQAPCPAAQSPAAVASLSRRSSRGSVGGVPLRLIAGPANAGKVELLLERYLAALRAGEEPVLVVPNQADIDRVERELLAREGALLGGTIDTFDDLFDRIAKGADGGGTRLGRAERSLLVRRVLATADLGGYSASAARGGFAESLLQTLDELEAGLLEPADVGGEL